jgi:hypothetical protein
VWYVPMRRAPAPGAPGQGAPRPEGKDPGKIK